MTSIAEPRRGLVTRGGAWARVAVVAALLVMAALGLSAVGQNLSCGFGRADNSDEPGHYVTGLLIRDYLAMGFPEKPMDFAIKYYIHYPNVALGVWPPFFHGIEALWMLAFSSSRTSVLVLMALISVASAVTLFIIASQAGVRLGLALFAAFMYIAFPDVQISSSSVMVDGWIAALELWAVVQLVRYIDTEEPKYIYGFGLLATAAALSKANGLALMLAPPIAIGLTAKWWLLRRKPPGSRFSLWSRRPRPGTIFSRASRWGR